MKLCTSMLSVLFHCVQALWNSRRQPHCNADESEIGGEERGWQQELPQFGRVREGLRMADRCVSAKVQSCIEPRN